MDKRYRLNRKLTYSFTECITIPNYSPSLKNSYPNASIPKIRIKGIRLRTFRLVQDRGTV